MNSSKSDGSPGKSIVFVVDNIYPNQSVDYYVSDETKLRVVEKRCKESKHNYKKISGRLRGAIKPIFHTEDVVSANYIVFNSYLYRFGGHNILDGTLRKNVDYLDLKKTEKVWVPAPEMNHSRYTPCPVILGGQLYVVAGLLESREESKDGAVLMEVLKIDGSGWEDIPNPCHQDCTGCKGSEKKFGSYARAIVGAVKTESKAFIIVGIPKDHLCDIWFELFTYAVEAEDEAVIKQWMPYTKINLSSLNNLDYLPQRPAVVYGQLILFPGDDGVLYVIDLENDELHSFDFYDEKMTPQIPEVNIYDVSLVMMEPGKFGLFWAFFDTFEGITTLMCSMFTVKRKTILASLLHLKPKTTTLCVELTQKSHWFSLNRPLLCKYSNSKFPHSYQILVGVFLVDHHIPDPPKHYARKDYGLKTLVQS